MPIFQRMRNFAFFRLVLRHFHAREFCLMMAAIYMRYMRQRLSLDISIITKYVYVRKHTHNNNEKATEIMFYECNEN